MSLAGYATGWRIGVRIAICAVGVVAIGWGVFFLPLFWQQGPLNRVASQVREGHTFKRQTLLGEGRRLEAVEQKSFCNPTELLDLVVLHVAILNNATAGADRTLLDSDYAAADDAARKALYCEPSDSFAWLVLFWIDASKYGVDTKNVHYLRMSYAFGPNEGWIARWRNRLAIAVFQQLPSELEDRAVVEFGKLLETGEMYAEAASIYASAAPEVQSRLVAQLKTAKAAPRRVFAATLYDKGFDVDIPGFEKPARPWR
jgi:hypothetical protein